jgi:MoaA/NifB/PqqE/SkfB family radical SAM enzyme
VATSPTSGCWAPDATLYFGPDGSVRACCVNTEYPLGHVGQQTIGEIWHGARTAALRAALADGDFSLGCQECGAYEEAGNRSWSNAPQFDEHAGRGVPEHPRRMDFILSNTCNLMCEMCHGGLSSAIRAKREKLPPLPKAYGDEFFEELREYLPHLEKAMFLGGEPFLAREARRVWDLMIEMDLQIPTGVVTNGTQWNPKVERYLHEIPMDVTVSIDGATPHTVESLRVGTRHDELMANVDRYQAIVEGRGGHLSLHFCLMAQNWHELADYLLQADEKGRSVGIMTVTDPVRFSLFHLPAVELEAVLRTWEDQDRTVGAQLGPNRDVWDAELRRLRRHVEQRQAGEEPVWIRATSERPVDDPTARQAFDRARDELDGWAGRSAIVLRGTDDRLEEVDVPEWAAHLEPDAWVGASPADLMGRVAVHLGAPSTPAVDQLAEGVMRSATTFGGPDGTEVRALAMAVEAPGEPTTLELHVYVPAHQSVPASA